MTCPSARTIAARCDDRVDIGDELTRPGRCSRRLGRRFRFRVLASIPVAERRALARDDFHQRGSISRRRPLRSGEAGAGGGLRGALRDRPRHRTGRTGHPSGSPLRNPCAARRRGTRSATIARLSPPSRTASPSMNDEEQVPQAGLPAAAADAEKKTPVERLEALGVRGILWQLPGWPDHRRALRDAPVLLLPRS
jgi:hypothetical protein